MYKTTIFLLAFCDRVSLCNPGWPQTQYVDPAGLELIVNLLSLHPSTEIIGTIFYYLPHILISLNNVYTSF